MPVDRVVVTGQMIFDVHDYNVIQANLRNKIQYHFGTVSFAPNTCYAFAYINLWSGDLPVNGQYSALETVGKYAALCEAIFEIAILAVAARAVIFSKIKRRNYI